MNHRGRISTSWTPANIAPTWRCPSTARRKYLSQQRKCHRRIITKCHLSTQKAKNHHSQNRSKSPRKPLVHLSKDQTWTNNQTHQYPSRRSRPTTRRWCRPTTLTIGWKTPGAWKIISWISIWMTSRGKYLARWITPIRLYKRHSWPGARKNKCLRRSRASTITTHKVETPSDQVLKSSISKPRQQKKLSRRRSTPIHIKKYSQSSTITNSTTTSTKATQTSKNWIRTSVTLKFSSRWHPTRSQIKYKLRILMTVCRNMREKLMRSLGTHYRI